MSCTRRPAVTSILGKRRGKGSTDDYLVIDLTHDPVVGYQNMVPIPRVKFKRDSLVRILIEYSDFRVSRPPAPDFIVDIEGVFSRKKPRLH